MEFDVDATAIHAWAARVGAAEGIVHEEMRTAMGRSVLLLEGRVKTLAPVKTGTLRRSIAGEVRGAGGDLTGVVGTNAPYARYVEEGRGPVVARGKALRFVVAGRTLFRKRVGPAKARPYFRPAFAQSRAGILAEFAAIIPRLKSRLGL